MRLDARIGTLCAAALMSLSLPAWAAEGDGIQRTASGRPDLSGTYDVATLTPLQRPEKYGENLYLTLEEADAIEAEEAAIVEARAQNSNPDREAPPEGGDGSSGGAGNVGGYNTFWIDRGTDAFSIDGKFRTSILVDPANGRMPPMTEEAAARSAERRKLRRPNDGSAWWLGLDGAGPYDGPESLPVTERCIVGFTGATPTLPSGYNNHKAIVQTEDHVMILIEMVHDARIVRMNSEHPGPEVRRWLGDSIGWWEGDTLVVDTTNFHPKAFLRGGSENMHVVERFTAQPDGNLLYRFTVQDDTSWTSPWTGEYIWRSTPNKVYEYACHEGNYSMGGTLRGARLLESEAAASSGGH
ncbi:MAG: hypothetical protein VYE73_18700 [Acidobacteriota bacterium]|nr:hypothetical protein [Acidobacteriota bacterium]